jgi:hypothetical protein
MILIGKLSKQGREATCSLYTHLDIMLGAPRLDGSSGGRRIGSSSFISGSRWPRPEMMFSRHENIEVHLGTLTHVTTMLS